MKLQKTFFYNLFFVLFICFGGINANAQEAVKAAFSTFDYPVCAPVKIQFSDNSTGNPESWFWDFGNGQTSTSTNPSATFTDPGSYRVVLVVSNAFSTDSTFLQIDIAGAKAEFNYTYADVCKTPATLNFSVPGARNNVIYRWDFGDENKAIIPNPSNTYTAAGRYRVSLTTISPEGCTDSIAEIVQIGSTTVDFDAPETACVNQLITFDYTTVPQPLSAVWRINGVPVQQGIGSLTYQFKNPGTYTIQLTGDFGSCQNTATKEIRILPKATAGFSLNGVLQSCAYPDTVRFTNTSKNAVAFKWYFGDGDSSVVVSPAHVYGAGRFSPMLVAINANGCADTLVNTDAVFLGGPIVDGFNLPDSGCVPHAVTFRADVSAPEAIAAYAWDFGDGATSVDVEPTHQYTTEGIYNVTLVVTTVSGCSTTRIVTEAVKVGTSSKPDFTADKTVVCGSEVIQFNGTASGPVTSWLWRFGNIAAFSQNPKISYTDTGYRTVKLIVNNNGCVDSVVKPRFILIQPSVSSFRQQYFCDDRSKVQFNDKSIAAQTWLWDFDDGTTSNLQTPPLHAYQTDGRYFVTLTTTNGACTNTYLDTIYINTTTPVFTFNPPDGRVCRKTEIELGVDNPRYILDYLWDLDDGRTLFSDTALSVIYYKTGTYYPSLISRYNNGCQDTIFSPQPIVVTGPTASFATELPAVCLNDTTTFIDKSFSDGEHDIISRVWSYGDDITESDNEEPFSHLYTTSGTFRAMLAIADNNNCVDTFRINTIVNALPVVSAGLDTFVCKGGSVQLQPSGALTYVWERAPTLSCFNCSNPDAAPQEITTYTVTGTDASSCRATDSVVVNVVSPMKLTVEDAPQDVCLNKSVQLSASGVDVYTWLPAAGLNNPSISNPLASPDTTTTYAVVGSDSKNCFSDTGYVMVNVRANPEVAITNNDLVVEKGTVTMINTTGSANINSWSWSPPLGFSCITCPQPMLVAEKTQTYNVVVYADYGCTDTAQLKVLVLCDEAKIYIPSGFTPNNDGRNDRFYIKSSIDNPVRTFLIFNRAGEMLFSKKGNITNYATDGWDGTFRGIPAPPGTYIYRIEVVCNDTIVPFTGTITLIR